MGRSDPPLTGVPAVACAPHPGGLYRHHRGALYRVVATGRLDGRRTEAVVLDAVDPLDRECRIVALPDFVVARPAGQMSAQPRFARVAMPTDEAFGRQAGGGALPADLIEPAMARYADPHRFYHAAWPGAKVEFLRRRHRVLAGLAAGAATLAMPAGFHAAFAANLERLGAQAGG